MSFEEAENDASNGVSAKQKIVGVIVLTDNRKQTQPEKSVELDFKSSAFKQTEIDPLQYHKNQLIVSHEENIYAQLHRRVQQLEERVRLLSNSEGIDIGQVQSEGQKVKKKNRRKFKQLSRNQICMHCQKLYGSQTSLKHHIKLKHLNQKEGNPESQ